MKLPIPIFGKKEKTEYLLALLLRQEKACAVIISQRKSGSSIVGRHEEYFQTNLEEATDEEWLKVLDSTISKAEEGLPPRIETHKTIFGVPTSWVTEKHIKKDYLLKLKKISGELALTPIGFLEIPEAIVHLMQEEEGAPISAILVEIGKEYLSVSLVRGGRVVETKFGNLVDTPTKGVDTLLRSFENVEVFPSRIIIFNGGYDEKLAQSFISHQWSRSLPFLHVPQISILREDFDAKAVVFGAASQMGFDVLDALSVSGSDIKTFPAGSHVPHPANETTEDEKAAVATTLETKLLSQDELQPATLESFGFVKDRDIAETESEKKDDAEGTEERDEIMGTNEPKGTNGTKETEDETIEPEKETLAPAGFTVHSPYAEESNIQIPEDPRPFPEISTNPKATDKTSSFLSSLSRMPQSLLSLVGLPRIPQNRKLAILVPIILIMILGLIVAYVYLIRATIKVNISPKAVDQNENIIFSTGGNDFDKNTIQAKTSSISLPGSTSVTATGKKETGTKAKGTVTVFNSADVKRQIQEGTTIITSNNLEFTLDKDVTIASATGDIFTGIKSGTAQTAVTAKQIGTEYNIPSNIKFTVGNNASLAGKNESAFSGGSKKNITVIAQADIDRVVEALPKSLNVKAREQLSKKLSAGQTLLNVFSDFKPSKKDFSESVGDEAKTLTLTSSVTFEGISYGNTDLLEFTKSLIKDKFDPKLTASDSDIENTLKSIKQKDETSVTAVLAIRARLLPKIDEDKLRKELAGESFTKATTLLTRYPQVEDVEISLFPPIPFLPQILPRQADNITIDIHTNE